MQVWRKLNKKKKGNIIDYLWWNSEYGVSDGMLNRCCSAFLNAARRALRLCILSFSIIDCKHYKE